MLNFLKNLTLADNETIRTTAVRSSKDRNPKEADLRIFKDGSIYPSEALVKEFQLEYTDKEDVDTEAFGFDITDSREYSNTRSWPIALALISIVPKSAPKVDLFGSCGYNEDGTPAKSVLDQGANTYGKNVIIPMLKEIYNIDVETAEKGYVDLTIVRENGFTLPSGIYYLPKMVTKGEAAGQVKVQRREGITLWPLVATTMLTEESTPSTDNDMETAETSVSESTLTTMGLTEANLTKEEAHELANEVYAAEQAELQAEAEAEHAAELRRLALQEEVVDELEAETEQPSDFEKLSAEGYSEETEQKGLNFGTTPEQIEEMENVEAAAAAINGVDGVVTTAQAQAEADDEDPFNF